MRLRVIFRMLLTGCGCTRGDSSGRVYVDAVFCNIPIHSSACPFLAIMLRGLIHLDHVLNFGASPSPGIFGRVADVAVHIYLHRGIEAVIKWVDDFVFLQYPIRRLLRFLVATSTSFHLYWLYVSYSLQIPF